MLLLCIYESSILDPPGWGCILTEPLASPPHRWTRPQSLNPWLRASSFFFF